MVDQRNIVILGAAHSGLQSTHYIMKHILPALKGKSNAKYHVYILNPSPDFYFRIASPRVGTSTTRLAVDKIFAPLSEGFKNYPADDFTFVQAPATGIDPAARTITYRRNNYLNDEQLSYHALIIATGTSAYHPAFSSSISKEDTVRAIKNMNTEVSAAKRVVIVGGGPTGVETAGEIGEHLNGKPGWFSSPQPQANIKLITASHQLLPTLRASLGKEAEKKLNALGVDVVYNTRVADIREAQDGRKTITLASGEKLETDLYIPAHGVRPNSSFLPSNLLNETGYLLTNDQTLRVDAAGPRVYALGDISSASRNTVLDLLYMLPVVMVNLKRDLLSFNPSRPDTPAPGKDRVFKPEQRETMVAPIGTGGGIAVVMGFRLPSWVAWLVKGRDYLVKLSMAPQANGSSVKKEYKWTKEEAV